MVIIKKIFQFLEALRWKYNFNYKTKDFQEFIESQNENVYKEMNIMIQAEREGCWLEFLLVEDEKMFEEEIKQRKEKIYKENNHEALAEIQEILNEYNMDKERQQFRGGNRM